VPSRTAPATPAGPIPRHTTDIADLVHGVRSVGPRRGGPSLSRRLSVCGVRYACFEQGKVVGMSACNEHLVVEQADNITPKKLRWLWPQRIPLGKLTLFAGLPGEGKSLATIDVAARVTRGRNYSDAMNPLSPSEVLFVAEEDDPEDALIPRLMAADADLSKVKLLRSVRGSGQVAGHSLGLDADVEAIKQYLREHPNVRLIVIDPVSNHLGSASMQDEQEVRRILGPLQEIARMYDLAIICVMHLNKKEGLVAIHRVGGAGAFIGVARASWLFIRQADAPLKRFMLPLKNNYGKEPSGLGYQVEEKPVEIEKELVPTPSIVWLDETNLDADEALSTPKRRASRGDAKSFLEAFLAKGPQEAPAVYAAAAERGISERTLDRAKRDLGVESRKKGADCWEWALPDDLTKDAREAQGESGILGTLQLSVV